MTSQNVGKEEEKRYNMGGRGASSGGGGGGSGYAKATIKGTPGLTSAKSSLALSSNQIKNDYTDNGNPILIKFQGQSEDKTARYLAKVDKTTDLNKVKQNTGDKWDFHDNPQQRLVADMGLNKSATVMSESDFNKYVSKTNSTVLYRGWSGQDAVDRFKQSPNSHIGNGIYGDGYYFTADKATAKGYGGTGMKAALSPNARVVSIDAVNSEIQKSTGKLQRSLAKAGGYGANGTRSYGANKGQAQMALKMGYNTIDAGWAVIPLTRDAVVVSNKNIW